MLLTPIKTNYLARKYNKHFNKKRKNISILINYQAFKNIKFLFIYYAIHKINSEYIRTKILAKEN